MGEIMRTVITIQHTQSIHHTNGMVGSWTDWDLSDLGKKQAENIGRKLSKEFKGCKFAIYSSDLKRAKQTAEIVGRHMGAEITFTKALRERNLGKCCGKSVQWLKDNIESEEKTVDDRMFCDAESRRDEWNRLLPFFQEMMNSKNENIIIVSHGDLLSIFNFMWLGLNIELINKSEIFGLPGGISLMIENNQGKHIIKKLSDMSYIE